MTATHFLSPNVLVLLAFYRHQVAVHNSRGKGNDLDAVSFHGPPKQVVFKRSNVAQGRVLGQIHNRFDFVRTHESYA